MYNFMLNRCQKDFQEKIQANMAEAGVDSLILTTPQNIFYATGYISPWLYNGSASTGTDIAVVNAAGKVSLITSQFFQGGAELQTKGDVEIISYPTWIFIEDYFDPNEKAKEVQPDIYKTFRLAADVVKSFKSDARVGIESANIPYDKYRFLQETFGADKICGGTELMIKIRTVKFSWEIDVLRYSAQIAEKMMNFTMENTRAGMTEADLMKLWFQSAYEFTGGHEVVDVVQYHTPGPDFWATGLPRERPLKDGDVVRLDGGLNIYGYISDLGRSYAVGKTVEPKKQAIFDTLLAARDAGIEMLVPGNRFCDVFNVVMKVCHEGGALSHYVRGHCGHTIGLGPGEEYPMLNPDNEMILKPGMVFCFETPYYSSKYDSYNLEDTLVITENGHELFTNTNRSLFIK
ncbi:MAG: Xaa-Pro peptidase family protein [Bacillota bacterium]